MFQYYSVREVAKVIIAQTRSNHCEDEASREAAVLAAKELTASMLAPVSLRRLDLLALAWVGMPVDGSEVLSEFSDWVFNSVLVSVAKCRDEEVSRHSAMNSHYTGLFHYTTFYTLTSELDPRFIEATKGAPVSGMSAAVAAASSVDSSFGGPHLLQASTSASSASSSSSSSSAAAVSSQPVASRARSGQCSVCYKPFKSITLRSALRQHYCRFCGRACCMACCATKVYVSASDSYIQVCINCTVLGARQTSTDA